MTFRSKILGTSVVISLVVSPAIGQERLVTSPDRTFERRRYLTLPWDDEE